MVGALSLYAPGTSPLHRLPASTKLLGLLIGGLVVTVPRPDALLLGIAAAGVVALYLVARLGLAELGRQIWGVRWIIAVVLVGQLIFLPWHVAALTSTRMLLAILLAALVTLTTRASDILEAIERGLAPLRRFGLRTERIALVLGMAIRAVPIVIDLASEVRDAQRARGVGGSITAMVVLLLVGALRHADDVADALAARGMDDDEEPVMLEGSVRPRGASRLRLRR
ncbi:MAG: energy-coupling factor transporter transmembrane protein EcfT [Microcella sp.]|uniref:energy-coupling factor transporter transmembrane component T family protein n=1 Tax=Microcella sp. TaxID=1913979 RepID=UPI00271B1BE8|nr:energy-coupling factor transporter transmembrane protein EcfT [Microcella sp.]MDO8337683.1 energy-coupling factor transporter transmembrane protein EcfT [Microcella sp.]